MCVCVCVCVCVCTCAQALSIIFHMEELAGFLLLKVMIRYFQIILSTE